MSKVFKRLTVPLTENGYKAIEKLAEARSASLGSTVCDVIEENHIPILQLAEAIEAAKTNPGLAYQLVQEMAAAAQKDLAEEQLDFLKRSAK